MFLKLNFKENNKSKKVRKVIKTPINLKLSLFITSIKLKNSKLRDN